MTSPSPWRKRFWPPWASRLFYLHGRWVASHPLITLFATALTVIWLAAPALPIYLPRLFDSSSPAAWAGSALRHRLSPWSGPPDHHRVRIHQIFLTFPPTLWSANDYLYRTTLDVQSTILTRLSTHLPPHCSFSSHCYNNLYSQDLPSHHDSSSLSSCGWTHPWSFSPPPSSPDPRFYHPSSRSILLELALVAPPSTSSQDPDCLSLLSSRLTSSLPQLPAQFPSLSIHRISKAPAERIHLATPSASLTDWPAGVIAILSVFSLIFAAVSHSLGTVELVKSKYGLGLSALVTVALVVTSSLGGCARLGIIEDLVPWETYPPLLIAIGVTNLYVVTNGVIDTSMDLPVQERVALGRSLSLHTPLPLPHASSPPPPPS
ncbi:MAG: hypothetical protein DHS80DRAFT_24775 [Piptocephalis tieghemiana]|nr:MAG: hypothetical protein DHS80DRAFT_24775 [Piptocephalis tieghemiana]